MHSHPKAPTYRFGVFELDAAAYQLRREGRVIRLTRQPMEALILLLERGQALVTHDEMAGRLWEDGVFVDRDAGLHTAILKIRQARYRSHGSWTRIRPPSDGVPCLELRGA